MTDTKMIAHIEARSEPDLNTGCRLWALKRSPDGYGKLTLRGRGGHSYSAHRVSFEASFGPIPHGLIVLHKCDTPACVNPEHLFLGTNKQNAADKVRKGRADGGPSKIAHRRSEIYALLRCGASRTEMAKHFSVDRSAIGYYAKEIAR